MNCIFTFSLRQQEKTATVFSCCATYRDLYQDWKRSPESSYTLQEHNSGASLMYPGVGLASSNNRSRSHARVLHSSTILLRCSISSRDCFSNSVARRARASASSVLSSISSNVLLRGARGLKSVRPSAKAASALAWRCFAAVSGMASHWFTLLADALYMHLNAYDTYDTLDDNKKTAGVFLLVANLM